MRTVLCCLCACMISLTTNFVSAQVLTPEDSLNSGLESKEHKTLIGGYGEAAYTNNLTLEEAHINLTRAVIFIGHRFSDKISFFSEMEIEDAKVDASGGELALEQCFLKFQLNRNHFLTAGLFIPRLGIINENHLPTTYFGNHRPFVETKIIPSTWRELGVSLNGKVPGSNRLDYTLAIVNGLNAEAINAQDGLREARFEGRDASARNLAVTASILGYWNAFKVQLSAYTGGSVGLAPRSADSLQLESGMFGTPVSLLEGNISYRKQGWTIKALYALVSIPDAGAINKAYANNCPEQMSGWYAEAGYNILRLFNDSTKKDLSLFGRYESVRGNDQMPENGIVNDVNNFSCVTVGLNYTPLPGVVVKADLTYSESGIPNPQLQINPFPQAIPFETKQSVLRLGIGYSF